MADLNSMERFDIDDNTASQRLSWPRSWPRLPYLFSQASKTTVILAGAWMAIIILTISLTVIGSSSSGPAQSEALAVAGAAASDSPESGSGEGKETDSARFQFLFEEAEARHNIRQQDLRADIEQIKGMYRGLQTEIEDIKAMAQSEKRDILELPKLLNITATDLDERIKLLNISMNEKAANLELEIAELENRTVLRCAEGWVLKEQRCYFVSMEDLIFNDALKKCGSMRGKLAEPKNEADQETFKQLRQEMNVQAPLWIGIRVTSHQNKTYEFVSDGSHVDRTFFSLGEPNNMGNDQFCLALDFNTITWDDDSCDRKRLRFICEANCVGCNF